MITSKYEAKCDRCSFAMTSDNEWPEGWVIMDRTPVRVNHHRDTHALCAVCADSLRAWVHNPERAYTPMEYEMYVGSRIADWEYELLDHDPTKSV